MADGTVITYWRKIKMLATSYNAALAAIAHAREICCGMALWRWTPG